MNQELMRQFRSPSQAGSFADAYEALLSRWTLPVDKCDLQGPYGTTRVNVCGPNKGPPLVLLHGHGCTSAIWFANASTLARIRRVYAIDVMGQAGFSLPSQPITNVNNLIDWLDDVLERLELSASDVCGHSYGAWFALQYALKRNNRVSRIALLDPTSCFAPMSLSYRLRAVPLFVHPTARAARRVVEWESRDMLPDADTVALMCIGGGEYRRASIIPSKRPSSEELCSLSTPMLIAWAERSRVHDIVKAETTASTLIQNLQTVVLPAATHHSIPMSNAELLNIELDRFFAPPATGKNEKSARS